MVLLSILMLCVVGNVESSYNDVIINRFSRNNDSKFSNLAVDKNHGWVFIGDVNHLYQLDENLSLVVTYKTGRKLDSLDCPMPNRSCSSSKNLTDNYNKALVIDYSTTNTRLISCGSIYQGLCEVHDDISNISAQVQTVYHSVVANDENSSTIAFIGPGPMNNFSSSLVLYVGATNTDNSFYQKEVPVIASRSLEIRNLLQIIKKGPTHGTEITLVDPKYTINYIFGFSSGLFAYFLTTQMKSLSVEQSLVISKLIRICNEDDRYSSYTEIPIKCIGKDDQYYNMAQAAFVTRLDSTRGRLLGLNITSTDDVLFVVFSQSEKTEGDEVGKPSKNSALCVYSLKVINQKFIQNIQLCSKPNKCQHPEHIVPSTEFQIKIPYNINDDDFCRIESDVENENFNTQLRGDVPVESEPLITYNAFLLTAVAVVCIDDVGPIVYLGTSEGLLKKIVIQNSTYSTEIDNIQIDNSSVNPNMLFDSKMNHLYVMTKNILAKIRIHKSDDKHENTTSSECATYTSCTACVSSRFQCNWCLMKHQCVCNANKNVGYSSVLSSEFCNEHIGHIGSKYCPAIKVGSNGENEKFISTGTNKSIEFKIRMFAEFFKTKQFLCQFILEDRMINVSATLVNNRVIRCDSTNFNYFTHDPSIIVKFNVLWGGWRPLEHLTDTRLILYKCDKMASNCSTCLTLENKYECGWCGNVCVVFSDCRNRSHNWRGQNHTCFAPSITSFEPEYGNWNEQNNITIQGTNLCSTIDNVCDITVAGLPCIPLNNAFHHNPSKTIFCQINRTDTILQNKNNPGPVIIQMGNFFINSSRNFTIIELDVKDIFPKRGPQSGGTELTFKGSFMDFGDYVKIFIMEVPCQIFFKNSSEMKCCTGKSSNAKKLAEVIIKHNASNKPFKAGNFEYTVDPIIESFEFNNDNSNQAPKSIVSGGIKLSFRGQNFTSIQKPLFYVYNENMTKRYTSECQVLNSSMMSCFTPSILDINSSAIDQRNPIKLNYGFEMDNVAAVQNISMKNPSVFNKLMLYPDPTFKSSPNEQIRAISAGNDKFLFIEGKNINFGCRKTDIVVKVGTNRNCEIESLSAEIVSCRVLEPNVTDRSKEINDEPQEVIVHIGQKFQANVGKLVNESSTWITYISCGTIFILISVLALLLYNKFFKKSQDLKKVCKRLNELELKVAKECKASFADLQIEVTDLTTNVTFGGIPFLDYHTHVTNVIFSDIKEHAIIFVEKSETLDKEEGLKLFGQLLLNEKFLLLFIQTLENHKNFSINERTRVACLIMITQRNDMEYCTNILKTLLTQLIEKYVRGNNDPKLMLRQSSSIVEKMLTIWFTFLLYKFLKERVGEPLYKLFCAIKQNVSKGPIDAITYDARYSLNEDKIIRQDISDFKTMTIYVSVPLHTSYITGLESTIEEMPVKVLDCDTISQVKEKAIDVIYSNIPYSQRPVSSSLKIEWINDEFSKRLLSDYDSSSKVEHEWKQINTLRHYEVTDFSIFNLVSVKEASISNASTLSLHTVKTISKSRIKSIRKRIVNSLTTSAQPNESNIKTWHIVKPPDQSEANCSKKDNKNDKLVSEIYLTRLLATKSILQKFVDDLFEAIFDTQLQENGPPLAIKYIFDFLDDQALKYGIIDSDVVHAWKNNCLPLRYWVNLIKNPNFLFDVHKSNTVDSCLSVIAQAFMDSCSTSDHYLNKDSPASKLLYAKDIPINRKRVKRYYYDIKYFPAVPDKFMNTMLSEESHLRECEFNTNASLYALYKYAVKYKCDLMISLQEDEIAQKHRLMRKLIRVYELMKYDLN